MDIDELFQLVKTKYVFNLNLKQHQRILIEAVLEKKDAVGLLPTGYGKSLCYILPPLMLGEQQSSHRHLSLVVSPLLSLMKDQQREMGSLQIQSVIASHESKIDIKDTEDASVILTTPETLQTPWFRKLVRCIKDRICLFACDEAHCVSEWGESFRPDYRHIASVRSLVDAPLLALTATCTQRVQDDINDVLLLRDPLIVAIMPDRPNIFLSATTCSQDCETELEWLMTGIKDRGEKEWPKTIIFCRTYAAVYNVWSFLHDHIGKSVEGNRFIEMFHSSTDNDSKERILDEFKGVNSQVRVLVATVAFGMGVSINDVQLVIHWGAPKNVLAYWQEVGRAGRDGNPALALMYAYPRSLVKTITDIDIKTISGADSCIRSSILSTFKTDTMRDSIKDTVVCGQKDCPLCICSACKCCSVCWAACQCVGKQDMTKFVL